MKFRIGRSNAGTGGSRSAGGGCLIVFGSIFGGIGLIAFVFLAKAALDEAATYSWAKTPCRVESCEIEDDRNEDSPFRIVVRYSYEFEGKPHTSTRYTLQESRHDKYEKLALKRRDLLSDGVHCYVNPEAPAESVLGREGLKAGLFALFPLIFVTVGGLIIWAGVAAMRKNKATKARSGGVESISAAAEGKASGAGWKIGALVGGGFFVLGSALIYPLAVGPISRMLSSESWIETPCKVIWSTVRRHESTDSDGHTSVTWSVDIFYEYEVDGRTHRSNNYGFFGGSSSGRSGKQAIVNQYPQGSQQTCYVNPELPEQAVLKPGLAWTALLGLIPLVFAGIGALLLLGSLRAGRKKRDGSADHDRFHREWNASRGDPEDAADTLRSGGRFPDRDFGPRVLKPSVGRLAKTGGCLFFALFWNGIVSVFVYQAVKGFQQGNPEWFLVIFLIPFVLVGLGVIAGFLYQLLAMANPKPILTLNPGTVRLGESFDFRWELRGSASRLTSLKFSLWGIESATYRRGTNTHTSNEVFYADEFVSTSRLLEMQTGSATVAVPGDLIYSIDTGNNEIKYEIRVEGDIPFWPDIGDQYVVTVLPPDSEA